jgi:dTDP-4-amino-4,6-dideoxygalactose transaminase
MIVPLVDLKRQYEGIRTGVETAIKEVIETTSFIGGPIKNKFEENFARLHGVPHCIGVGNGTDSLFLILRGLGIGAGDEVVTAANSFIASSEAISLSGARPVFVDIDPATYNMDLDKLEELLSLRAHTRGGKIRAIMPVHLYGRIVNMSRIMSLAERYDLKVIEDSAQAHLAKWDGRSAGSIGHAGSFSFYPGKNLGAFGDAGAITTSDDDLAARIRKLANHGRIKKYDHDVEGVNSRLDTIQAAVLNVKLPYLQIWSDTRYKKALIYDSLLKNADGIVRPGIPPQGEHVFHLYVVRVKNRDKVISALNERGIGALVHYPIALPNLQAYRHMAHKPSDFPVASLLQDEILSLPMFPEISEEEQSYVAKQLIEIVASLS